MILIIDHYDSFVYNLARYFECVGEKIEIARCDRIELDKISWLAPEAIILSPGPKGPSDTGISRDIVRKFGHTTPILGVCLGCQVIADVYGARVIQGEGIHGKASEIFHNQTGLFHRLPTPFKAGRYHSLICHGFENTPLQVTARTREGTAMAIEHVNDPVYGVQFHPESILTEHGTEIIQNFLGITRSWNAICAAA